jgi:hypothetical protein
LLFFISLFFIFVVYSFIYLFFSLSVSIFYYLMNFPSFLFTWFIFYFIIYLFMFVYLIGLILLLLWFFIYSLIGFADYSIVSFFRKNEFIYFKSYFLCCWVLSAIFCSRCYYFSRFKFTKAGARVWDHPPCTGIMFVRI